MNIGFRNSARSIPVFFLYLVNLIHLTQGSLNVVNFLLSLSHGLDEKVVVLFELQNQTKQPASQKTFVSKTMQ